MADFSLGSLKMSPSFTITPYNMPFDSQLTSYVESVKELARRTRFQFHYNAYDVYASTSKDEVGTRILAAAYPLKKILESWSDPMVLLQWELYYKTIYDYLANKIASIEVPTGHRRVIPWRTVFIGTTTGDIVEKLINKLGHSKGATIHTQYLTLTAVDSLAKSRDVIMAALRIVDLIIVGLDTIIEDDTSIVRLIIFSILNIHVGGCILVKLPFIRSTAVVCVIALACMCFERTYVVHTVAADGLFLYCGNFLDIHMNKAMLVKYVDAVANNAGLALFDEIYMRSAEFTKFATKLLDVNHQLFEWRYSVFYTITSTFHKIKKSPSNNNFAAYADQVLKETFADETKKWINAVDFTLARK